MTKVLSLAPLLVVLALTGAASGQPADLPTLLSRLEDPDPEVRWDALVSLEDYGAAALPGLPAMVRLLQDPSLDVRSQAAMSLGNLGLLADPALPALVNALSDDEPEARLEAAMALGEVKTRPRLVLPALAKALCKDPSAEVRRSAASSISEYGTRSSLVLRSLGQALSDPDPEVRETVAGILSELGPRTGAIVPNLVEALRDPVEGVRFGAVSALSELGPRAAPAIPNLRLILSDADDTIRYFAASTLGTIGAPARVATPDLLRRLREESDESVQRSVIYALGDLGHAPEALLALEAVALGEGSEELRLAAIGSLADVGGLDALPALIVLTKDSNERLRSDAEFEILALGMSAKEPMWWVLPTVYAKELVTLLLFLAAWAGLAARYPRRAATTPRRFWVRCAMAGAVPALVTGALVYWALEPYWCRIFVPKPLMTQVPISIAGAGSAALVAGLLGVWAGRRPRLAPVEPDPPATEPVEPSPD